jgi:MOB kinase activator 1
LKHATLKRATLSASAKRTLGVGGNLTKAVKLPEGEETNDWFAANTVDFYNELNLIYGLIVDSAKAKYGNPGDGFPPGYEYRWPQPGNKTVSFSQQKVCSTLTIEIR